jgi:DNA-binding NtrC family response regulator
MPAPSVDVPRARRPWQPAASVADAGQPPSPSDETSGARAGPAGEPVRVLVVDDQPDVLATTAELFRIMGYEVHSASNGADAIAILERNPDIQVLFSDVVMPGMNGVVLGREARKLIPRINVILASGFHTTAVSQLGADMKDFHFLAKPFRMTDVARVLRK